jgi:hypothetical protein
MFKKFLNDVINSKLILTILLTIVIVSVFKYVVYPGLNDSNVILNITSTIVMVLILLFTYFYIKHNYFDEKDDFSRFYLNRVNEPETELDYTPINRKTNRRKNK